MADPVAFPIVNVGEPRRTFLKAAEGGRLCNIGPAAVIRMRLPENRFRASRRKGTSAAGLYMRGLIRPEFSSPGSVSARRTFLHRTSSHISIRHISAARPDTVRIILKTSVTAAVPGAGVIGIERRFSAAISVFTVFVIVLVFVKNCSVADRLLIQEILRYFPDKSAHRMRA